MAEKGFSESIDAGLPALPGIRQHRGVHLGADRRFGIVVARFNLSLTSALATAAVEALLEHGAEPEDVELVWVPGSFEIPLQVKALAASGRFDALIACGVVIDGQTRHAELITNSVTAALLQLSLEFGLPVIDAVVTARSLEQAEARCLSGRESRGWYAGLAALETASLPKHNP